jgi:hypothetical protein
MKNMKKKNVNVLSESYSHDNSIVFANITEKNNDESMFKFVIEQGNSYNRANVYIRTKNKGFENFTSYRAVPQLKFNTTYIYKSDERVEDHKRIIKEMIDFIADLLLK